jgi:hypothetical protein
MLATMTPIKGRWGYYALDYDAFLKLKAYHKLLLRDRRATARFKRWGAKLEHNRVVRHKDGTSTPIPKPMCMGTTQERYMWVLTEYRKLRHPVAEPELIPTVDLPKGWEADLEKLAEFYPE